MTHSSEGLIYEGIIKRYQCNQTINNINCSKIQIQYLSQPNNLSVYQTFIGNIQFLTISNPIMNHIQTNKICGYYTDSGYNTQQATFVGMRWNILSPGIIHDGNTTNYIIWQNRARNMLKFLMMTSNPNPLSMSSNITKVPVSNSCRLHRDDNCNAYPQNYEIYNLSLNLTIPNSFNPERPYLRKIHGFMAFPFDYKKRIQGCIIRKWPYRKFISNDVYSK